MKFKTRVVGVSGTIYTSDDGTEDVTEKELEKIEELLCNPKKLSHFLIIRNGRNLYFNPDNIESIQLIKISEFDEEL